MGHEGTAPKRYYNSAKALGLSPRGEQRPVAAEHQAEKGGPQVTKRSNGVPDQVHRAAENAWEKFRDKIASVEPAARKTDEAEFAARHVDAGAGKSPEERMIEKIHRRMEEFPEWYETDPDKVAEQVSRELERIGDVLGYKLPGATEPVEIWEIPLSVFNWLEDGETGETFVHGALSAWSSAEKFNASNRPGLAADERDQMRAPFLEIAPVLLTAVLEELLEANLWITFAEKFVGPELKFLSMRAQVPTV